MALEIQIQKQTEAMIKGITEVIPPEILSIISEKELGVRFADLPLINSNLNFIGWLNNYNLY